MFAHLLLSAAVLALGANAAQAEFSLTILHTNDFHSRIEPINKFDSTCTEKDAAEDGCFGGVARLKTRIDAERAAITAAGGNVVLLDAGDASQGSLMYTTYKGAAEADFLTELGYQAMAVGNHEFDLGPEGLATYLDRVTFPVVGGNLDVSQNPLLAGRLAKTAVIEVGGQKVGIVSALAMDTPETSSPGASVVFQDDIDSLKAGVAELQAAGVGMIVALTHLGYKRDMEIAAAVPGVDIVVGGHSHTYLSANDPDRDGPYPTWVSRADGSMVPVVQAFAYGKYLGRADLTFDDAGNLIHAGGNTLLLDGSVAEDAGLVAKVKELAGPIEAVRAQIVAEATAPIDGARESCRQMECQMGNLVTEAMLDRVADQGVTIAITNGGGLRASIDGGKVSMGAVLTVLPFQNTLSTFKTPGATLVAALENGVSQIEDGGGRFPQVAGMKFTFDPAVAPGARVSDVMVKDGEAWVPIDPARDYLVVTNNYVRRGGDGYKMFADAAEAYDFGPDLADVTAEYLAKTGPYTPFTDGRIIRK